MSLRCPYLSSRTVWGVLQQLAVDRCRLRRHFFIFVFLCFRYQTVACQLRYCWLTVLRWIIWSLVTLMSSGWVSWGSFWSSLWVVSTPVSRRTDTDAERCLFCRLIVRICKMADDWWDFVLKFPASVFLRTHLLVDCVSDKWADAAGSLWFGLLLLDPCGSWFMLPDLFFRLLQLVCWQFFFEGQLAKQFYFENLKRRPKFLVVISLASMPCRLKIIHMKISCRQSPRVQVVVVWLVDPLLLLVCVLNVCRVCGCWWSCLLIARLFLLTVSNSRGKWSDLVGRCRGWQCIGYYLDGMSQLCCSFKVNCVF